jgi:hypothetical protein
LSSFRDDRQSARGVWSILMDKWDPFGVRGVAGASDEYDQQVLVIVEMLERGVGASELADYLARAERELLAQDPDLEVCASAAAALVELRDS